MKNMVLDTQLLSADALAEFRSGAHEYHLSVAAVKKRITPDDYTMPAGTAIRQLVHRRVHSAAYARAQRWTIRDIAHQKYGDSIVPSVTYRSLKTARQQVLQLLADARAEWQKANGTTARAKTLASIEKIVEELEMVSYLLLSRRVDLTGQVGAAVRTWRTNVCTKVADAWSRLKRQKTTRAEFHTELKQSVVDHGHQLLHYIDTLMQTIGPDSEPPVPVSEIDVSRAVELLETD